MLRLKFYPTRKPHDDRSVPNRAIINVNPVVTTEGLELEFLEPKRRWTPAELSMLASWAYSLSNEAKDLAKESKVKPGIGYNVETNDEVVCTPADK